MAEKRTNRDEVSDVTFNTQRNTQTLNWHDSNVCEELNVGVFTNNVACENIRFSALFAAGDVRAKRPQRRRARRNGCFRRLLTTESESES